MCDRGFPVSDHMQKPESTFELLSGVEALFEHMPGSLFFVKDRKGRFLAANEELVRLFGASNEAEVIGLTDADFLPAYIAEGYRKDDRRLFEKGVIIRNRVELVTTRDGVVDWIVTTKVPLRNTAREIVAVGAMPGSIRESSPRQRCRRNCDTQSRTSGKITPRRFVYPIWRPPRVAR